MYHFTYITASESGHYYVGRHSTRNINDGYLGSGKWVQICKKYKIKLHRKILYFYENFEKLLVEEKKLIIEHIHNTKNMNLSLESSGFSAGKLNPSKSQEERKRRSEFNWMKTDQGRQWISENNPSKKDSVKKLRSQFLKQRWLDNDYRKKIINGHHSKKEKHRIIIFHVKSMFFFFRMMTINNFFSVVILKKKNIDFT